MLLQEINPIVFVEAIMESLMSRDSSHSRAAIGILDTLLVTLVHLMPTAASYLPVIGEIASRLCHACYKVLRHNICINIKS